MILAELLRRVSQDKERSYWDPTRVRMVLVVLNLVQCEKRHPPPVQRAAREGDDATLIHHPLSRRRTLVDPFHRQLIFRVKVRARHAVNPHVTIQSRPELPLVQRMHVWFRRIDVSKQKRKRRENPLKRPRNFPNRRYDGETCNDCLLYTSPSPRDATLSRMPSSA